MNKGPALRKPTYSTDAVNIQVRCSSVLQARKRAKWQKGHKAEVAKRVKAEEKC